MLIAAKVEELKSPNFKRMIVHLNPEEREHIKVPDLVRMEQEILTVLSFDLGFPNPIVAIERYLRLLGFDKNHIIEEMAFQLSKFALNDPEFLNFRPSQIAACSVLISANIYKRDQEEFERTGVYATCEEYLDTDLPEPKSNDESFFVLSPQKNEG